MSLVGEERKELILQQLHLHGKVKTNELVEQLQVSSETVRRYLEELEEENKLKKVYGGAISVKTEREEPPHMKREIMHIEEKRRIGRTAASLVQPNDVIIIDDGTTPVQLLHFISHVQNLKVITVSINALNLLIEMQNQGNFNGEVFFIGGKVNSKHYRTSGALAEDMIGHFTADKAFISIDGMMLGKGMTCYDTDRAMIVRKFIENSAETIALTDHSKIGMNTFYKIAELKDIDTIICDTPAPKEWERELEAKSVRWLVAE